MRRTVKMLAAAATIAATCWGSYANAAFFGLPRALKFQVERILLVNCKTFDNRTSS